MLMVSGLAIGWCTPFTPVPLNAQSENGLQKIQQMAMQLALTPDQKSQFIPILVAEAPEVKAIKTGSSLTPIQKLQQIMTGTDPQVRAILSPQQYQELQVIRRQELQRVIAQRRNQ